MHRGIKKKKEEIVYLVVPLLATLFVLPSTRQTTVDIQEKVVFYNKIQHISPLTASTFCKERDLGLSPCAVYHASDVCRAKE